MPTNDNTADLAPEFTSSERLYRLIGIGLPAIALVAFLKFRGFPWLGQYIISHPCGVVLGFDLDTFVFYSLLGGLPALMILVGIPFLLLRALRIWRSGQFPPPGEKVWRPTTIRRGKPARFKAGVLLLSFVVLVVMEAWSIAIGHELLSSLKRENPTHCAALVGRTI
jgi:hypothetical protein